MEKIKELYNNYKEYVLFLFLLIIFLIGTAGVFYYFQNSINKLKKEIKNRPTITETVEKENNDSNELYTIDIKGEVRKPGVYTLKKGKRVIDVVKTAGGLTLEADTSANNLSMKITDEMVIIIYNKDEIKNYLRTKEKQTKLTEKCQNEKVINNSCIESVNGEKKEEKTKESTKETSKKASNNKNAQSETKLISINTATKEELQTLPGIGESKADAIIEYRKNKKYETIEEIKEVSGIGDALFEKIKDYITT